MTDIDLDAAERGLNDLIERRAQEAEDANRLVEEERQRERAYHLRRAAEDRALRAEHYRRMIRVHEDLAEENREKLNALIDRAA